MTEWVVQAEKLDKLFDDKQGKAHALKQVDFLAKKGKMTALIGPDGAGKTTTMRLICGLMDPTGGSLKVLGLDSVKDASEIQSRISYMPQKFGLYEDLTIQENMDLYADLHGVPDDVRKTRFAKLLDMTGLAPFTGRLAGTVRGHEQKLGLACTLYNVFTYELVPEGEGVTATAEGQDSASLPQGRNNLAASPSTPCGRSWASRPPDCGSRPGSRCPYPGGWAAAPRPLWPG